MAERLKLSVRALRSVRYCAFCGKADHEVFKLIVGPGDVCICDECVAEAANFIQEARGRAARERGDG